MTEFQDYCGWYYFMGMAFEVKPLGTKLAAALSGVPEGYEIPLVPAGRDRFTMQGVLTAAGGFGQ